MKCWFCKLPLSEEYIVIKGKKMHSTCFCIEKGEVKASHLAEDIKVVAEVINKKYSTDIKEIMEVLQIKNNYKVESTCHHRAENIVTRLMSMGIIEGFEEERKVLKFVKVWRMKAKNETK
jgi:hypothetical protein